MQTSPRRTFDAATWTTLGGMGLVVVTCLSLLAVDLTREHRLWILGITALLTAAGVLLQNYRRNHAIALLEHAAAQMLSVGIPRSSSGVNPQARLDGPEIPGELAPLAAALAGLGQRIEVQLKDLAKKSRNLEVLIDAIDEPIIATDDHDRVLMCNRAAESMLESTGAGGGGGGGSLLGRGINELFTQENILQMHAQARAGQLRRDRVRVTTILGKRTMQVSAAPLPAAWGDGVFGVVLALRDVTELAQAVQVKTDFVANASHELRTPVAAIRGAAETLVTASDDPEMSERLRTMIVTHAARLEEMLRDLLDLSRLESPEMSVELGPVDMGELERTIRHLSEGLCVERHLTLSFELDPMILGGQLRSDRKLLTLILRNLVENATKFAHENTAVRVIGFVAETDDLANAIVRFEVIDQGVGIPLQHQERVFERYYQVDLARTGVASGVSSNAKRGTGLGLAIVKHAAKALHGRVGLVSEWGQGTTVWVEIPTSLDATALRDVDQSAKVT